MTKPLPQKNIIRFFETGKPPRLDPVPAREIELPDYEYIKCFASYHDRNANLGRGWHITDYQTGLVLNNKPCKKLADAVEQSILSLNKFNTLTQKEVHHRYSQCVVDNIKLYGIANLIEYFPR